MKPKVTIHSDGTQSAEFQYDFALDAKALEHTVDENGDLWIEGYASDFGIDRQEEAFEPGAFERGLKSFLERNPIMLYHHQYDKALGQFTEARVDENGLWVKGRVDAPAAGSWAEDVFNKIRKGTIKAFSVGGIFRRRMTKNGPRIHDVDLGEISVTPFPVNPRTTFAVVAGKAFGEIVEPEAEVEAVEVVGEEKPDDEREGAVEVVECAECAKRAAAEKEAEEATAQEGGSDEEPPEEVKPEAEVEVKIDADTVELLRTLERLNGILEDVALAQRGEEKAEEAEETITAGAISSGTITADKITVNGVDYQAIENSVSVEDVEAALETLRTALANSEGKALDHSSAGHAGLERSFRKNWVEKVGGFPKHNWIYRAAKHLHADAGMPIGQAIAVAVNAAKKLCASGDLNFSGTQHANPGSRAEACAAVAEWEAMKARAKAD